jgi:SAM-dependent methyltransferase
MNGEAEEHSFEQVEARLSEALNGAGIALMLSLGHRSGLLDALRGAGALSSEELAARCGLHERYVREWAASLATARILLIDVDGRFELPDAWAQRVTRAAGPKNSARSMQYVAMLGQVEDDVLECFERGGGVPYERFRRFHEIMAEGSSQSVPLVLREHLFPSLGDLQAQLERGIDVLDIGCGSGGVIEKLAAEWPQSRFVGVDFDARILERARDRAASHGLTNLRYEVADAARWRKPESLDLILAFDAIHDQGRPLEVLRNLRDSLRSGGLLLMQELDARSDVRDNLEHPMGPFYYAISCMHCMTVSLAQDGGEGLGNMWGRERATAMLEDAGFADVEARKTPADPLNVWYVAAR